MIFKMKNSRLYVAVQQNDQFNEFNINENISNYHYLPGLGTEYELFKQLYSSLKPEQPWGLVSSKFNLKSSIDVNEFYEYANDEISKGVDCVYINPMILNESLFSNVWEQGVIVGHRGLDIIVNYIMKKNNLKLKTISDAEFAFCNYFIAGNKFWKYYFNFVDTCIAQLEEQVRLKSEVGITYAGKAGYHKNQDMSMKPFVVERLLSLFIAMYKSNNNLIFLRYEHSEKHYTKKAGHHYGQLLFNLKCAKNESNSNQAMHKIWNDIRFEIMRNTSVFHGLLHLDDPDFKLIDSSNTIKMHLNNIVS
jgi:hypothetical protein